ncbi:glycoside hydrolase family 2 protein [Nocardioides aequoreus]|uniref:glycoside hydrolase family 2 protein n=1 Tax=Nocardioides aequoreus TaxID=397278 RepID=UPI0004C402B6|nr:sugar-binding domain-containing protein [Nocardioides aequoreus]
MLTRWGRDLDRAHPLPEHPRPQLVREGWSSLNGPWQHAFTADDEPPVQYDGPITVPFSPETRLSGSGRQLQPDERLWYRREVEVAPPEHGGRVLLHFGAVDQRCTVWVDGTRVGGHVGGYLPFTLDVTEALAEGDRHELVVRVRDVSETGWHARGKQRLDRGEIWYTAQSGIWQTVWLEVVPAAYVADLALVPDLDHDLLLVTVEPGGAGPADAPATATVVVRAGDAEVARADVPVGTPAPLPLPGARRWSPEDPFLHDVEVTYGDDRVTSYAGMRSVGVGTDADGHRRLLLNGAPYPHVGLLDQGYWPESLLTPPSDAAIVSELELVRSLGFTVLRKHAKVEPLRWYHHCDRLGLLVWQDVVNGGERYHPRAVHRAETERRLPDRLRRVYGRSSRRGRREFLGEVDETVRLLRSAPSVVVWTPFNEGWGQFDANRVARRMARLDPTRLVLQASGWVDQGGGDLRGYHSYLRHFTMPRRRRGRAGRRPVVLSEYGGYALLVPGHSWGSHEFGYRGFGSAEELTEALVELHDAMSAEAAAGLAATVYTQLTDVEDEVNGLLTWDREVLKVPAERLREITASLRAAMTGPAS